MPVILSPVNYDLWLDPGFRDVAEITAMLTPFEAEQMRRYPVSARVNNVANDDSECSKPIDLSPAQARLFLPATPFFC
jgi:putative SOS response-associated peptidase YedK